MADSNMTLLYCNKKANSCDCVTIIYANHLYNIQGRSTRKKKSYHTIIHLHLQLVCFMQTLKAFPHTALMFNNPDVVFGFGFFDEGLIPQF